MIIAQILETDKATINQQLDELVEIIVNSLEAHIGFRVLYECNAYRGKSEDYSILPNNALSRFTIMTFADDTHEESPIDKYIADNKKALENILPNALKANTAYFALLYVLRVFNEMCILCLDGKPILNGKFLTIEEARRECNTIN